MTERTNCRGVPCERKTNSVVLCSQTMNQSERHAFVSFTRPDDLRKHETIVGIYEQETNGVTED